VTQRESQVLDEYSRPVPGASIYVFNQDGSNASLTSDGSTPLMQPVSTDEYGIYSYHAPSGIYREDTYFGGKLRHREVLTTGLDGFYPPTRAGKFFAFDAEGQPIASAGTGSDAALRTDLAAGSGAALSGFIQTGTGAVSRSAQTKLRDTVSVKDFGAVGDGTTDDSAAFQAALNTKKKVLVPYSAAGYKTKGLQFTADTSLVAEQYTRIIASDTFATIGEAGANIKTASVEIRNLNIDMRTAVNTASAAFVFAAGTGGNRNRQWNITIDNINVIGAYCTVKQANDTALSYMLQTYFTRVNSYFPRGTSWNLPNLQGFVMFWSCQVDWTADTDITLPMVGEVVSTPFAANYPAFLLGGSSARSAGVQLHWCAVSSSSLNDTSVGHGFVIRNMTAATLKNCEADGVTGTGFKIGDAAYTNAHPDVLSVSHLVMTDCVAFSHGENGFDFDNVASAQITNMRAVGRNGVTTGNAAQIGVKFSNSHDIVQDGTVILNQRGGGFYSYNCHDITGSPMRVRNCGGKAAQLTDTTDCIIPMALKACSGGLHLSGFCTDNLFPGLSSREHTGAGLTFDGTSARNTATAVALIGNGTYGRQDLSAANYNVVSGGSIVGNASGNIVQLGAGSATTNYVNDAEVFVASSVGAGTF